MALITAGTDLIIGTNPKVFATDIPVDQVVSVTFQRDIDVNSINTSTFRVTLSESGREIKGDVTYERRIATFKPAFALNPGEVYQVTIVGESNPDKPRGNGVKDILGNMLFGNYSWTFTTKDSVTVQPPSLVEPLNETLVGKDSIEFSWERPEGAVGFELQVAKDRNFRVITWPKTPSQIAGQHIMPDFHFTDGQYFWRVRAVDSRRRPGRWSEPWVFVVDTKTKGTVAEGDTLPPEVIEAKYLGPLEVAGLFPSAHDLNIDLNLGAIVIKLLGHVDASKVNDQSFRIFGRPVANDPEIQSHGQVEGSVATLRRGDMTYIVFQPEPLQ